MKYQIEKIAERTYRQDESGKANCYLVIGIEKALLIDGCWGIGHLDGRQTPEQGTFPEIRFNIKKIR
ncbi:MAG: hypothetical protein PUG60_13120 [Lachnospiraceae bacterium]|nr:hypothetical protein [Lachnospiraceae bacterium]MDY4969098.1 hypothetical protein [Lachnospiraceae bacterium]